MEVDFKTMKNVDLVRYAQEQGHNVRGLSRDRILDKLTVQPAKSIALPDEEATLCAMRSCPNRIPVKTIGSVQTVLAPKERPPSEIAEETAGSILTALAPKELKAVVETLGEKPTWQDIRSSAKLLGISTYHKSRTQVEAEIKEKSDGK